MEENKKYDIIYADPPWTYKDDKSKRPALGGITYPVMKLDDIKNMGGGLKVIQKRIAFAFYGQLCHF